MLAVIENYHVIPDNSDLVENCCDFGFRPFLFSEIVYKP